jgi:hypothetical protein
VNYFKSQKLNHGGVFSYLTKIKPMQRRSVIGFLGLAVPVHTMAGTMVSQTGILSNPWTCHTVPCKALDHTAEIGAWIVTAEASLGAAILSALV